MKVYLATRGEYSDYGVIGVFSTYEAAEKFMLIYGKGYDGDINPVEEFELDEQVSKMDLGLARYEILWRSKSFRDQYQHGLHLPEWQCSLESSYGEDKKPYWSSEGRVWHAVIYAKNEKAALKIASEKKRESVARNENVPEE